MKLFIFGSTGDLVKRKVLRALQELDFDKLDIFAIGRRNMEKREYQDFICSDWCRPDFRNKLHYVSINFEKLDLKDFVDYLDKNGNNYFYLSLPPALIENVLIFLGKVKDAGYKLKVLSEKPFGVSLKSALKFEKIVGELNFEDDFFISDHYLFKKNFLKLPKNFSKVKIVSVESVGLEGRVGYYDSVGAMRDMIQSHFLNLVIKNMNFKFDLDDFEVDNFIRGQYEGYVEDLGSPSKTETYVRIDFSSKGKNFEFITGKSFSHKEGFIEVDGELFEMGGDNSYVEIFNRFLDGKMEGFPTIEDSILAWKIIQRFESFETDDLLVYPKGVNLRETAQ